METAIPIGPTIAIEGDVSTARWREFRGRIGGRRRSITKIAPRLLELAQTGNLIFRRPQFPPLFSQPIPF